MKSFREYITEALLEVDKQDINKLYAPYIKPFKELQSVWNKYERSAILYDIATRKAMMNEFREIFSRYPENAPLKVFQSSELKSELAKQAHSVNPITIYVFLYGNGNYYAPEKKLIYLSLDVNIIDAMRRNLDAIPVNQLDMLKNESQDLRAKTTIRHELTHWIDDSLHNFYMTNKFRKARDIKNAGGDHTNYITKSLYRNEADPYLAPVEITAMVNQVAELKRRMTNSAWNKLTWVDLLALIPPLHFSDRRLGAEFRKRMIARMSREGLVGKNLTKKLS